MMMFSTSNTSGGSGTAMGQQQQQQQQHQQIVTLPSMHMDYIHKVAFDTYGRRMATCSGDRFVRLWDLQDSGEWIMSGQWQAHRGAVTALAWAHPEFGSLLATAGADQDAKIWEELSSSQAQAFQQQQQNQQQQQSLSSAMTTTTTTTTAPSRWMTRASLTEARRAVTCLEFAPRHWGLKLAIGSADGCVRIYEAVDIMNLSQWPLAQTLESFATTTSTTTTGGGSTSGGSNTNISNFGGGGGGGTFQQQQQQQQHYHHQHYHKLGCTSVSWCTGRFEPPTLVAGGNNQLIIYRYSEAARAWQALMQLPSSSEGSGGGGYYDVLDVAWAPNVGRRFHYIASAEDQHLRIYKLLRQVKDVQQQQATTTTNSTTDPKQNKQQPQQFLTLESSQIIPTNAWQVKWNVTGTVLASSGDGGMVQLWKPNVDGDFQCVSHIQGDLSSQIHDTTTSSGMTSG